MRKFYLTLALISCLKSFSQTPAFVKDVGKLPKDKIGQNIECSCIDPKGKLTVGHFKSSSSDTLIFKKWDGARWNRVNTLLGKRSAKNLSTKCIYTADSFLYVVTDYVDKGRTKTGLFYLPDGTGESKFIADFRAKNSTEVFISNLKIIDHKLVVFGRFDSTYTALKQVVPNYNLSIFEYENLAGNWGIDTKVQKLIKEVPIITAAATIGLTTVFVANNNAAIYKYTFPDQLEILRAASSTKSLYSGVHSMGDKWLITRPYQDSALIYDGKSLTIKVLGRALAPNLSSISVPRGLLIAEDSKTYSSLLLLDSSNYTISTIYKSRQTIVITPKSELIKTPSGIYYTFNIPLIYRDTIYDNIVELFDMNRVVKLKEIVAYLFYDKNNNFKKDAGDVAIEGKLYNRTLGNTLTSSAGKFVDKLPDYMDAEYELLDYNSTECLKLPFSAALQSNSNQGNNDPLYFPLQKTHFAKDINVKSWGKATARLFDTIPIYIKVNNRDCDLGSSNVTVRVDLDTGTVFINSTPPFSYKLANTLFFNLSNLKPNRDSLLTLFVKYTYPAYKTEQLVSHYIQLNPPNKEDTLGNLDSIVQRMVYSYDPNAKYSIPEGTIKTDLKNIRYFIQFQNEGNDEARRVTIMDTLDSRLPVYEFQMVAASHPYSVSLKNNAVTWVFDNINLPPKKLNESASQGYVVFDAHVIANLNVGDSIRNKAFIYFDFNEPIITNLARIQRIEDLPIIDDSDLNFKVFPNPANALVNIQNKLNTTQSITVFNMLGQQIEAIELSPSGKTVLSITEWPNGMYFVRSSKGGFLKFLVH